jgi:hypothetical protein
MYARVAKQVREHAAERARRARTHVEVLAALDEVHTAQQAG